MPNSTLYRLQINTPLQRATLYGLVKQLLQMIFQKYVQCNIS